MDAFVAVTDADWFRYLAARSPDRRVDEVNFWSPSTTRRLRVFPPGAPVFFRLKAPVNAVAGYGFFAEFAELEVDVAWRTFGDKNGAPDIGAFLDRMGAYRRLDLSDPAVVRRPLGCTLLRDARFWPREQWIPFGPPEGWHPNTQRGATARGRPAERLLAAISDDALRREVSAELMEPFVPVEVDARRWLEIPVAVREGQGAFRTRLLNAYGRRCAITGERTEPVLDAAHIQPYLGARSNHVQNGLLLTKEFHALFDEGLVGIDPDYRVHVSPRIQAQWSNGKRYYAYDGQPLANVPRAEALRPSRVALERHFRHRYDP